MNRILIAATALLVLGTPVAFATSNNLSPTGMLKGKPAITETYSVASASPSARCMSLERQFSKIDASETSKTAYNNAVRLRNEGRNLCTTDRSLAGISKLEQALRVIGVRPTANG